MSELENSMNFGEMMDDGLDIDAIFGGGGDTEETANPFADASKASEPTVQENTPTAQEPTPQEAEQNLFAAFDVASTAPTKQVVAQSSLSLFDKPPVFSYGGAKESIEDGAQTFEDLRIAKADDFPELEDGKAVSWTVKYGAVTQSITDPKGKTIAQVKEEIEKSKPFLTGLQKAKDKDKNPDCLVTPTVKAKSKGIASYKGVFPTLEDARVSDKVICLIPAKDGQTYEVRRTEMGEFIAPKSNIIEFSEVRAGFSPALPLIPRELMGQIISFFRSFMNETAEDEALAYIYWDRQNQEFVPFIPKQRVSKASIYAETEGNTLPEERYLHYADIHSHNSMRAGFSAVDDKDERATKLYIVLGRLDRFYPSIAARVSCGGTYLPIDPELVIEGIGEDFPTQWLDKVTREKTALPTATIFGDLL